MPWEVKAMKDVACLR